MMERSKRWRNRLGKPAGSPTRPDVTQHKQGPRGRGRVGRKQRETGALIRWVSKQVSVLLCVVITKLRGALQRQNHSNESYNRQNHSNESYNRQVLWDFLCHIKYNVEQSPLKRVADRWFNCTYFRRVWQLEDVWYLPTFPRILPGWSSPETLNKDWKTATNVFSQFEYLSWLLTIIITFFFFCSCYICLPPFIAVIVKWASHIKINSW